MSQTEFDAEMERVDSKAVRGLRIPSRCHRCSRSPGDGPLPNGFATPVWAVVTSYISERFPTAVRASGHGIGYSAATIIPAFSSFYMLGLKGLGMPYAYTGLVILALGGLLLLAGALSGPETKHVDIN